MDKDEALAEAMVELARALRSQRGRNGKTAHLLGRMEAQIEALQEEVRSSERGRAVTSQNRTAIAAALIASATAIAVAVIALL